LGAAAGMTLFPNSGQFGSSLGGPPRREQIMKGKRFTEEQIAHALRQAESGTPVADVCRQLGVSEASFYLWKKKFGRHGLTEIRELR
jgi:transposase-like protein